MGEIRGPPEREKLGSQEGGGKGIAKERLGGEGHKVLESR